MHHLKSRSWLHAFPKYQRWTGKTRSKTRDARGGQGTGSLLVLEHTRTSTMLHWLISCDSCSFYRSVYPCIQSCRPVTYFVYFSAGPPKNHNNKIAVIKSATSAASARGGCASSRLDHGLKFHLIRGGCASSRLINEFSGCDIVTFT